ncbi:MAG: hypothetical protein ABFD89_03465 [Bryobacteraceae bacterium]
MLKNRFLLTVAAAGTLCCLAEAVETRTWHQSDYEDFEKGSARKVSLRSDGRLMLAPAMRELLDSPSPHLWALAEDSKGNLFVGGGGPGGTGASVYAISREGKSRLLVKLEGLEVHALAIDRQDRLYAATSPDGKIYRISASGAAELFYAPGAKYIWAMAFDSKGNLFAATGDKGEIHRVTPQGKGSVFFVAGEIHARSLVVDGRDNLIAGTDPGGLILRITPEGKGFVLYQAPKREITAVAVAADGSIYAAGTGGKQPASAPPVPAPRPTAIPTAQTSQPAAQQTQQAAVPPPSAVAPAGEGSEIYRIAPDGYPSRVWNHPRDVVYSIAFDREGQPLAATGNRGTIYRLDSSRVYTALVRFEPAQATALLAGRTGEIYAATGNIGKVYQLGPGFEKDGSIESDVFDAGFFSRWGRLAYRAQPNGGAVRCETRSGNVERPGKEWSPWQALSAGEESGRIESPRARFLQWRLTLTASQDGKSPEINSVETAYMPKNVAPVIDQIEITPPNYRFPAQSLTLTPSQTLTLQPLGRARRVQSPVSLADSGVLSMQYAKGQLGARWAASDENGDDMLYKVEIRGTAETEWKLLKEKVKEKYLSWDSTTLPDGEYRLRVMASDSPDNPPAQALNTELVSEPFTIDNSAPAISGLTATRSGGKLVVRWNARDALSVIKRAEYSVNGGEWTFVEPTTGLSDSKELSYELVLEGLTPGEKTVAVRVTDEFDNQSVEKTVVP